ncbi:MAG: PD-(D/E)XK nuclease family protein [Candidatus Wildermuthbacteria bacterium]|nr:PD-(D/E)XK nuclease family protein [Candidatus Wildermuthbacteria bacterium]
MSDYYSGKRSRNIFDPASKDPFVLSRTKLDLFMNCPRCFYLDIRLGVGQPPGYPFTLNSAVDKLLKKEFDLHRAANTTHPLMKAYGIDAVPFQHKNIEEWRDALSRGVRFLHEKTNLILRGGIDDIWQNSKGELHIVDYKATAKNGEITLDAEWQKGYKRQMEIYQWLFRMNGFKVSKTGYFVYVNGQTDRKAFDGKLEFDVKIIPYEGDDSWVEKALLDMKECLMADKLPSASADCDFCVYRKAVQDALEPFTKKAS